MSSEGLFDTNIRPADLDPGVPRFVNTPWGAFAIYGGAEKFSCAEAFCPHMDGPLFEGTVDDGHITCPWHRWRFRLDTGERVDGGEADPLTRRNSLLTCPARVGENGTIVLEPPRSAVEESAT